MIGEFSAVSGECGSRFDFRSSESRGRLSEISESQFQIISLDIRFFIANALANIIYHHQHQFVILVPEYVEEQTLSRVDDEDNNNRRKVRPMILHDERLPLQKPPISLSIVLDNNYLLVHTAHPYMRLLP